MTKKNSEKYSVGAIFNGWTLQKLLGRGGNGDVWEAAKEGSAPVAIKILRSVTPETYARFKAETAALENLGHIKGIVPIFDKFIPDENPKMPAWFTMPVATPYSEYVKDKNQTSFQIVEDFIALAKTIEHLHKNKVSHRDIKPANFLYYQGQLCISDFGLVKYPSRPEITPEKRDVGAKFTMAPEMRRIASAADGLPADVYSFSKSLWIALTRKETGYDGQYNQASTLALSHFLPAGTYTTTLDRLFSECTETEPSLRPTISAVISRLHEWLAISKDFHTRNLAEWLELTQKLFPLVAPTRTTWKSVDTICAVLSEIAKVNALNHMFLPSGGGNTITGVSRAAEPEMIALHVGPKSAVLLKPEKLTYESFGNDTNWSYFRLEAAPVQPTGVYDQLAPNKVHESLTEVSPGEYAPYSCWDNDEYDGEPLDEAARPVSRYLQGAFVFFSTRSTYNRDSSTYDARHNKFSEEEFRDYIERNSARG